MICEAVYSSSLKMEAPSFPEMLVTMYKTIRRHIHVAASNLINEYFDQLTSWNQFWKEDHAL